MADRREEHMEALARSYNTVARRVLIREAARHGGVNVLNVNRELPALQLAQITRELRPMVKAGLVTSDSATPTARSMRVATYSLTPRCVQAMRDLHAELSLTLAYLDAPTSPEVASETD